MAAPSTEGCVTDEFPLNPRSQLQTISPLGCGSGLNRLEENDGHDLSSHDVVGWIHRGSRRFDGLGLRLRRNDLSGQRDYEEDWRNLGGPTLVPASHRAMEWGRRDLRRSIRRTGLRAYSPATRQERRPKNQLRFGWDRGGRRNRSDLSRGPGRGDVRRSPQP